jgi:hypothetical protein
MRRYAGGVWWVGGAGVTGDSSLHDGLVVDVDIGAAGTTPDPTSTTKGGYLQKLIMT